MPPKKAAAAASQKKAAAGPAHPAYKDMIKEAVLTLKERNGSSRSALKKYILANHKPAASASAFDNQFNKALRAGVEKGEFAQPKGPSGTTKLAKKEAATKPTVEKKAAVTKKEKPAKATATKKKAGAPKKVTKDAAPKKAGRPKGATATKTKAAKANTATKRKTPAVAPAIVEEEKVIGKTKSGRVTKSKPGVAAKPKATKKATPKKPAAKKNATPKKKAEAAAST